MASLIKNTIFISLISVIIYLNLQYGQFGFLGFILLACYLLITSLPIKRILVELFYFSDNSLRTRIFSAFLSFFALGLVGGCFILLTSFNNLIISTVFLVNAILWFIVDKIIIKSSNKEDNIFLDVINQGIAAAQEPKAKIPVLIYLLLVGYGFYLLASSKTTEIIYSPWQTINSTYIYVFFLATFILGLLIYSKLSVKFILCFYYYSIK